MNDERRSTAAAQARPATIAARHGAADVDDTRSAFVGLLIGCAAIVLCAVAALIPHAGAQVDAGRSAPVTSVQRVPWPGWAHGGRTTAAAQPGQPAPSLAATRDGPERQLQLEYLIVDTGVAIAPPPWQLLAVRRQPRRPAAVTPRAATPPPRSV